MRLSRNRPSLQPFLTFIVAQDRLTVNGNSLARVGKVPKRRETGQASIRFYASSRIISRALSEHIRSMSLSFSFMYSSESSSALPAVYREPG